MKDRQKNDDTKTKLGDIYHYYVVLLHCLELQENETILVERYGDISIQSGEDSKNIEVKRHQGEHTLSERHIDFWKTLNNWLNYAHNMIEFKSLILYTTSSFGENSRLREWNRLNAFQRLNILYDIGREIKKKEGSFRPVFETIMNFDVEIILSIIEKIEVLTNQTDIVDIEKKIFTNSFFKSVKRSDRKLFVETLMGNILLLPVSEPHKWEISCEYFDSLACEIRNRFSNNHGSLGLHLPHNIPQKPDNEGEYNNKKFVKEIRSINYDKKIPTAISNYWRAQQAIFHSSLDNPIFNIDLNDFQIDINDTLEEYKLSFQDEVDEEDADLQERIKKSKKLYDMAMQMSAQDYRSVSPNRPYFQRGIIHKIVEERGFSWLLTT